MSTIAPHQNGMEQADTGTGGFIDEEYAGDVPCSERLRRPGWFPFAYILARQNYSRQISELLIKW